MAHPEPGEFLVHPPTTDIWDVSDA
jgi:hypothetical protein